MPKMNVKDVIKLAKESIQDIFEEDGVYGLLLEEIKFDDLSGNWLVTISFNMKEPASSKRDKQLMQLMGRLNARYFKVVTINDSTGQFLSLSIREVNVA